MPRPWRIKYPGAKYHVTTRGNARQRIFHGVDDFERFQDQLSLALELDNVVLYAYALLDNHTHLLVETPFGNINRFMQRLNTAYGMYRRYKRNKPGHCFQARYGAKLISGDEYLLRVTRYIHLNPVKVRSLSELPPSEKVRHLNSYRWSSYRGYIAKEDREDIVDYRWLDLMHRPTLRGNRAAYRAYVESMVQERDPVLQEAMDASRYTVGDEAFRVQTEEELRRVRVDKGIYGDILWPTAEERGIKEVTGFVAEAFGVQVDELRRHGRQAGLAKKVALELCCEFCGQSQREVGQYFGYIGNGSVGKQRAVLRELLKEDGKLRKRLASLREQLNDL